MPSAPIALFVNPRSRANRQDPGRAARLGARLGAQGRVIAPATLELMTEEARALATTPPAVVAIDGGDGTLHKTLTALIAAFGTRPLPPVAILAGGTMNVVAASLGIRCLPERFVDQLVRDVGGGHTFDVVERRCLHVGDTYGFVFGNGFMAAFLEAYYGGTSYGTGRALMLGGRLFASAVVGGPFSRRIFAPFRGRVLVDGVALPWRSFTGIGAGAVREIGLGFKLNHLADVDPERFSVTAIHAAPLSVLLDSWAVRRGDGISSERASSQVASRLVIEPEGPFHYTVDGDLYQAPGRLEVLSGPRLSFVRPRDTM